jgi:Flp pilus assembly protein TadD
MKHAFITFAFALTSAMLPVAHAADTQTGPAANAASPDFVAGQQAVDAKQWMLAVESFKRATLQDPKNADAWNMLGYSSRWAGKYPEAFDAYARALALEPFHRGANSYLGVAYVRTNDLGKARAQLAKLESICGNKDCDEYKLLAKAITDYKPN